MNMGTEKRASCLAVVTARAGSKGVRNKNLRDLAGKPMLAYTVETGLACPHIDEVVVTTDSSEMRELALSMGAIAPFLRAAHLASDTARQEDAILQVMAWYEDQGRRYDLMCLLEPTSPLRTVATLNRGFELLAQRPNADAVFSVTDAPVSPIYCNVLREDGTLKDFIPEQYRWANRQEIPPFYKLASLVTIARWSSYREKQTFLLDTTAALVVDPVEALDVDEPVDFVLVEHLLRSKLTTSAALRLHVNGPDALPAFARGDT